jgi:hypothetical protein
VNTGVSGSWAEIVTGNEQGNNRGITGKIHSITGSELIGLSQKKSTASLDFPEIAKSQSSADN